MPGPHHGKLIPNGSQLAVVLPVTRTQGVDHITPTGRSQQT